MTPEETTKPIAIFNPKQISDENYNTSLLLALIEVDAEVKRAKQLFPSMFINQQLSQ